MNETTLPPRKNKTVFILLLVIILVGANGFQYWLNQQNKEVIAEKDVVIQEKTEDLSQATLALDSMRQELNLKIAEIQRLGGDTASIGILKRQIERDLRNSRRENFRSREMIADLKGRIEDYELQLAAKDQEIERLKQENQSLFEDNTKLKSRIVQSEDSITRLAQTKARLSEQVEMASRLRAEEIRISVIDSKGREKEEEDYRARKIARLKVRFQIADNKVARIENKEVFMRITDPEGAYLYEIGTGGGVFQLEGRESPYTSKLSFLFDNKQTPLQFVWEKGSPYKTGTYTVELFCEGSKLGQSSFVVR